MSKLSIKDVEHIAKLSKLKLNDIEKEKFANQLSGVIEYVEQLNEVNTEGVEPTSQSTGLENVFREDEVIDNRVSYEEIERNAPVFDDGSFIVPGVFNN